MKRDQIALHSLLTLGSIGLVLMLLGTSPATGGQGPPLFSRKPPPAPGDWLDLHQEREQSFIAYQRSRPHRARGRCRTIHIQPLGMAVGTGSRELTLLRDYCALFFTCPVVIDPPLALPLSGARTRTWGSHCWTQYQVHTVLDRLLDMGLPQGAICRLGITRGDLYPEPTWNYVFGMASLREQVGVFSLARYGSSLPGLARDVDRRKYLERCFKVMAHETAHMFSLPHCVRYECLMNGSNSLAETDRQPAFLCPLCHAKLRWNLGFVASRRYAGLADFYRRLAMPAQADWLQRRLAALTARRK